MTYAESADEHPDLAAQVRAARDHHRAVINHPDPRDPEHPSEADDE